MIVNEGRNCILNKLFNDSQNNYDNYKLKKIFFSDNINETTLDMTYASIADKIVEASLFNSENNSGNTNDPIYIYPNDPSPNSKPYTKIDIHIKDVKLDDNDKSLPASIASMGLILEDSSDSNNVKKRLYSRIVFDPILISDDSDFTITYYVYI